MRLESIEYLEFKDEQYAWKLEELTFKDINLIVGKNATGKSRVLRIIHGIARLIDGSMNPAALPSGRFVAKFGDEKKGVRNEVKYIVDINGGLVTHESLVENNIPKLARKKDGSCSMRFEQADSDITVSIPQNLLAIASRRDPIQHIYFEKLIDWAKTVRLYETSRTRNDSANIFQGKFDINSVPNIDISDSISLIIKLGRENFNRDFITPVVSDMRKIGYDIADFGLMPRSGIESPIKTSGIEEVIFIKEVGIEKKLPTNELSSGMFRAFSVIATFHFIRLQKNHGCLIIDDIGEGLDYERSKQLINLIIEQAEKNRYMQIIMTTNDQFVMNNIKLDYWTILKRDKGVIKGFNMDNSKELFEKFEEYGLNNFDFFSNEYFLKK